MMDMLLNCLKPPGMTSHDVVGFIRKQLKTKKVGHAGTLDPAAAGVLVLGVGKGTRMLEYLTEKDKAYRCEMVLGIETDTQDTTGEILQRINTNGITEEEIKTAFHEYQGEIIQIPPAYSAVKHEGTPLYKLARQGKQITKPGRKIFISKLTILKIKSDGGLTRILFDVNCSKGTYVRTICHDIGKALGCGGTMSFLIRTRSGSFRIEDSVTLERFYEEGLNFNVLGNSIDKGLEEYPAYIVGNDEELKKISNGVVVKLKQNLPLDKMVRVYDQGNNFLGVGEIKENSNYSSLKMIKFIG
ncbi:tRNA pseudouridine55 synthase [Desulfitispora alkaliphila]|uniref:tRNA pseudouridine(55) synthase TruB n=1 Tax=Desulfitispora alkaliphila TaxID=622674 RepID=UPI003D240D6B